MIDKPGPSNRAFQKLEKMLQSKSIALFGASNQPGKVGYVCLRNLLAAYSGGIYPIHPQEKEILGLPAFPDLDHVPSPVDDARSVGCRSRRRPSFPT